MPNQDEELWHIAHKFIGKKHKDWNDVVKAKQNLISSIKQWAMRMVGKDLTGKEDMLLKGREKTLRIVGYNQRGSEIRQRIEGGING